MLTNLKQRALDKVNNSGDQIILKSLQMAVNNHHFHSNCDCEYCKISFERIMDKLKLHRLKKIYDRTEYGDVYQGYSILNYIYSIENKVKSLNEKRNNLKNIPF